MADFCTKPSQPRYISSITAAAAGGVVIGGTAGGAAAPTHQLNKFSGARCTPLPLLCAPSYRAPKRFSTTIFAKLVHRQIFRCTVPPPSPLRPLALCTKKIFHCYYICKISTGGKKRTSDKPNRCRGIISYTPFDSSRQPYQSQMILFDSR